MSAWKDEIEQKRENIRALLAELQLTISADFVPFSRSRNATKHKPKITELSLNWKIHVFCDGREVMTRDYSAGTAFCPSMPSHFLRKLTLDEDAAIRTECETGFAQTHKQRMDEIEPDMLDVMHSLIMDASAIDEPSFKDWAESMGWDSDSRKAESMYRECVDTYTRLRAAIGDANITKLQEAFKEY